MGRLAELLRRIGQLFRRGRLSRDLDAEMRFHLEMAAAELRETGMPPRDADAAARRRFGNLTRIKERSFDAWSFAAAELAFRDVGLAVRALARRPAFFSVAVASLGLGIGSAAAVAIVANALFLRPPAAVSEPDRLVAIYTSRDDGSSYGHSSYPDYRDLASSVSALEDVAASEYDVVRMDEGGARLFTERVTGNFFDMLGVEPASGRTFLPTETRPGSAEAVVVISHSLWWRQFGGDPEIVGRSVRLSGRVFTIIGVAPKGLASRFLSLQPDVWVPLGQASQDPLERAERLERRTKRDLRVLGRLRPGTSLDRVRSEVSAVERRLRGAHPDGWKDPDGRPRRFTVLSEQAARLDPDNRSLLLSVAGFFGVVSLFVLLAACTNVMSLFLAEIGRRRRELAVHLALGASRARVAALIAAEGLVIGLWGGVAGVLLAMACLDAAAALPMPFGVPFQVDLSMDWRVLLAVFVLALGASLACSLAPAVQASRSDVPASLRRKPASFVVGRRRVSLRDVLLVAQFAVALVLVAGATLMVRSLHAATTAEVGIDASRVAVMTKRVPGLASGLNAGVAFLRALEERLAAEPGVAGVAFSSGLELASMNTGVRVSAEGADPKSARFGFRNAVTPGYLELFRVPIRRGRRIAPSDVAGAPLAAVINEPMAELLWPGADPIGRRFVLERLAGPNAGDRRDASVFDVVGLARRSAYWEVGAEEVPYCWTALYQECAPVVAVSLKGTRSAEEMVEVLRRAVETDADEITPIDPSILNAQIAANLAPVRIARLVLAWGGLFTLALAVVGIYGAVSFAVTLRTRELAVRLAVGAPHRKVVAHLVRDGLWLASAGALAGTALAVPLAWVVRYLLYGVSPLDPVTFGLTALTLASAALVGSLVPARRALGIDPVVVLKEE